jgi:hypothetical protein
MSDLKRGIYSYLQSLASISGGIFADRVYPDTAPQGADLPYVVYYLQDSEKVRHLTSASQLSFDTFTLMVYAASSEDRNTACELLRNALHGRKNIDFPQASGSLDVRNVTLLGLTDTYEEPTDGGEQGAFVTQMDFSVSWVEPAPTLP